MSGALASFAKLFLSFSMCSASAAIDFEAFQKNRSLPLDPFGLSGRFWEELVVPVKPGSGNSPTEDIGWFPVRQGDSNAAVLALRWLLESTSQAWYHIHLQHDVGFAGAVENAGLEAPIVGYRGGRRLLPHVFLDRSRSRTMCLVTSTFQGGTAPVSSEARHRDAGWSVG